MPDLSSIRRLTLADLTQEALEELVRHGEDLLVERKQDLPKPPRFGAAAGSMANTLGGWILLGVADDGAVVGWDKPERVDLQSHLAGLLRAEVDPLPPFVAAMREVGGKPIAVVRVFPSVDSPHIVRGSGAVYLRSSKGKEPVDDHRTLLDLARRGEDAEQRARARLVGLPVMREVLHAPDVDDPSDAAGRDELRFIARGAPLTVTPALAQWPLSRDAAHWCEQLAAARLPASNGPWRTHGPFLRPFGQGISAWGNVQVDSQTKDYVSVVADAGGAVGIEVSRGNRPGESRAILLEALLHDEIFPALRAVAELLERAEAFGRAAVDFWIARPENASVEGQQREAPRSLHVTGELVIPADDGEVMSLAKAWHRELQRESGIIKYEPTDSSS